jgi:hypothetical protein
MTEQGSSLVRMFMPTRTARVRLMNLYRARVQAAPAPTPIRDPVLLPINQPWNPRRSRRPPRIKGPPPHVLPEIPNPPQNLRTNPTTIAAAATGTPARELGSP